MNYKAEYDSPLGKLTIVSDAAAITGLWIEGQKHFNPQRWENAAPGEKLPVVRQTFHWLDIYFSGAAPLPQLPPLAPQGTAFQAEVWELLKEIPYGQSVTYGQLSHILSDRREKKTMSAQAVGSAVGANPISILIPCHRVVGTGKNPGGYDGGLEKKQFLLELEKTNP